MENVYTQPLRLENFKDIETLMEARGGPDFCWCMAFRDKPREDKTRPASARRAWRKGLLLDRVQAGQAVGILAYHGETPIGWCSTGPFDGYRRLGGPKLEDPAKTWTISCFFIPKEFRKQGLMRILAVAAIDQARAANADDFRASPVAPGDTGYHFQGALPLFQALGFTEIGMAGNGRHIMRLPLTK